MTEMKKEIRGLTKIGYIAGIIFFTVSFLQYYILYRDIDRIIAYPIIGLLIITVSWLFNKISIHDNKIDAMGEYLADKKLERKEK